MSFDVMSIVRLGVEIEIGVDVQGVAGNALEQVNPVIGGNDMGDAVRQMVDRRSCRVLVLHSMNVPVDAEQQVRPHVAVQEQQRMSG